MDDVFHYFTILLLCNDPQNIPRYDNYIFKGGLKVELSCYVFCFIIPFGCIKENIRIIDRFTVALNL